MARRGKGPLEAAIEAKVDRYAKEHLGAMTRKMNGLGFSGWPDRLFLLPGCPGLWVEFKRKGEEPTPLQLEIHRQLRAQGREVWGCEDDADLCVSKMNAWYVLHRNDMPVGKPLGSPPFQGVPESSIPKGVLLDPRARKEARGGRPLDATVGRHRLARGRR